MCFKRTLNDKIDEQNYLNSGENRFKNIIKVDINFNATPTDKNMTFRIERKKTRFLHDFIVARKIGLYHLVYFC